MHTFATGTDIICDNTAGVSCCEYSWLKILGGVSGAGYEAPVFFVSRVSGQQIYRLTISSMGMY